MFDLLRYLSGQLIAPDKLVRKRFATFKDLLSSDRRCHHILADLETIYYSGQAVDINRLRVLYQDLSTSVEETINALYALAPGQYHNLTDYFKKLDFYCRFALALPKIDNAPPYILPINGVYDDDRLVGGKGLHLSHLVGKLNLPVPDGFIVSTSGWNLVVERNELRECIDAYLAEVQINSVQSLQDVSRKLAASVRQAALPSELLEEITHALGKLKDGMVNPLFAVRSSAVAEDSEVSFAGQYLSLLNVQAEEVGNAYLEVAASRYSPEAILYRIHNGLDDAATPMAVLILKMVQARVSGVVESTTSQDATWSMKVNAVKGLGDGLMAGERVPEVITYALARSASIPLVGMGGAGQAGLLSREEVYKLGDLCCSVHDFYRTDQEIEWSIAEDNSIFLLQSRTTAKPRDENNGQCDLPEITLPLLLHGGETGAPGYASGSVFRLDISRDLTDIPERSILVCDRTPPSLVALLPNLAGVIARSGSAADHFSSVAREFGIPVLLQVGDGIDTLDSAQDIFLQADDKRVYAGTVTIPDGIQLKKQLRAESDIGKSLKILIDLTSPLSLIDPSAPTFKPEGCRSLHDIVRFAHEKGVQAMFLHNPDSFLRKPSAVEFSSDIPLQLFLVDAGGGLAEDRSNTGQATLSEVRSLPFKALWTGLSHPGVNWQERQHFDWASYDSIALAGGISSKKDTSLLSYCLVSKQYLNVNMRFGYHFSLIDCFSGDTPEENYILLRFAGGGGTEKGKDLRLIFLTEVLRRLGFDCQQHSTLLDSRLTRLSNEETLLRLEQLGKLLGSVRLLDMVLKTDTELPEMVERFFTGTYNFSNS